MVDVSNINVNRVYNYDIKMQYVNGKDKEDIRTTYIRNLIIDHNIDRNIMPIIYVTMYLDKSIVDKLIANANSGTIILKIYKVNIIQNSTNSLIFEDKFTYYLPDDINKKVDIDSEEDVKNSGNDNYRDISIGLLSLDHVNTNKVFTELNLKDATIQDVARLVTKNCKNLVMETFDTNRSNDNLIIPAVDSVNKALEYLNNQSTFYNTAYRFYMDFKRSYLVSSSGNHIASKNDSSGPINITVHNNIKDESTDVGYTKSSNGSVKISVPYANTQVYDNTIANKVQSKIRGISSTGSNTKSLANTSSYSKDKVINMRINNDNKKMVNNLANTADNSDFFLFFHKSGLDLDLFTINKKITVTYEIDQYKKFSGDYLVYRIKHSFTRTDEEFELTTFVDLRKIGYIEV